MTAQPVGKDIQRLRTRAVISIPIALIVCLFCAIPSLQIPGWSYFCALLATVNGLWATWPAHKNLFRQHVIQDTFSDRLVSIATLTALGWSFYQLINEPSLHAHQQWSILPILTGQTPLFLWDFAAIIAPAAMWPKYRETLLRAQLAQTWESVANIRINEATKIKRRDMFRVIAHSLKPGDIIGIQPGERFPADGVVTFGESTMDAHMFYNQEHPTPIGPGDAVLAGAINDDKDVLVRVTHPLPQSTLHAIQSLLQPQLWQAQGGPGQAPQKGNAPVLAVIAIAAIAAGITTMLGPGLSGGVAVAVAVLAAASVTSLNSTAPLPLVVALHRAAGHGIYFADQHVMRWTRGIKNVVFARTGVLTDANHKVLHITVDPNFEGGTNLALAYAASLEDTVNHPIAHAILNEATARKVTIPAAEGFVSDPGLGVRGNIVGHRVQLATSSAFANQKVPTELATTAIEAAQNGETCLLLSVAGDVVAAFTLNDELRTDAPDTMTALHDAGYEPTVLTGADRVCAKAHATNLSATVLGELRHEQRLQHVADLEKENNVAVVAQRHRDADLLATATLSIASGPATGMTAHRTHISILGAQLPHVPTALRIATRTDKALRTNKHWVTGYNIVAITAAATGALPPAIAAIAMTCAASFLLLRCGR